MKKIALICGALLSLSACDKNSDVHLTCKSTTDSYDVIVHFLDDGAVLTVDGKEYQLKQEYDAPVVFYRFDPWYNLQIGNRGFKTKYSLGVSGVDGGAIYTSCEEID